jgi:dolichyl-phosphate-mannose-protein mannosyltransferase
MVPEPPVQPMVPQEPLPPQQEQPKAPPPPEVPAGRLINREKRVEYRDEKGNILNEEQVKSLKENSIKFQVRLPSHVLPRAD